MMMSDDALLAWLPASPNEVPVLIAAVQSAARQRGLAEQIPPPPDAPDNCCGNDCIECVWLGYYPALGDWRDTVVASWAGR